jgi:hypothetical protein
MHKRFLTQQRSPFFRVTSSTQVTLDYSLFFPLSLFKEGVLDPLYLSLALQITGSLPFITICLSLFKQRVVDLAFLLSLFKQGVLNTAFPSLSLQRRSP